MNWADPNLWIALTTLTLLEIVLGIDNVIFISILSGKLPEDQQAKARRLGLGLALVTRILLLCSIAYVVKLDQPFYTLTLLSKDFGVSGKSLILFLGGLFLIAKSTFEIHEKLEGDDGSKSRRVPSKFFNVILQILLLDIVFSLDSVITAVGMVDEIPIMVVAVVLAMIVMLIFVNTISNFVNRHPTFKILALSFLILIGVMLVAESLGQHIAKGYIYFAMAFSVVVECLNTRLRTPQSKVNLHQPYR